MKEKKQLSIENVLREFKRRGYIYDILNQGIHIRVYHSGLVFEVYPTTGTWYVQNGNIKGKTILALYDYINSLGADTALNRKTIKTKSKKIESKKEESGIETFNRFNRLMEENRNSKAYLLSH